MRKHLLIAVVALSLCGCSAQYRLTRLLRNNPGLIAAVDTVVLSDTVIIDHEPLDTVVFLPCDSVVGSVSIPLPDDSGWLTLMRLRSNADLFRLKLSMRPDTVTVERIVTVPQVTVRNVDKPLKWYQQFFIVLGGITFFLALLFAGMYLISKYDNRNG